MAMSFGDSGYACPTAIGVKVAAPNRPAVAYAGDGAWGISLGETVTAVREELPVEAADKVGGALRGAVMLDRLAVVELMVSQELGDPFRRDALRKPAGLLDKYKDLTVA